MIFIACLMAMLTGESVQANADNTTPQAPIKITTTPSVPLPTQRVLRSNYFSADGVSAYYSDGILTITFDNDYGTADCSVTVIENGSTRNYLANTAMSYVGIDISGPKGTVLVEITTADEILLYGEIEVLNE